VRVGKSVGVRGMSQAERRRASRIKRENVWRMAGLYQSERGLGWSEREFTTEGTALARSASVVKDTEKCK
jgi:hypothetical protein